MEIMCFFITKFRFIGAKIYKILNISIYEDFYTLAIRWLCLLILYHIDLDEDIVINFLRGLSEQPP